MLLHRPRVGLAEAHKLSDVQRFFVVLSPESREGAPRRMIAIGKKRMPNAATRERFFGFVQATAGTVTLRARCLPELCSPLVYVRCLHHWQGDMQCA